MKTSENCEEDSSNHYKDMGELFRLYTYKPHHLHEDIRIIKSPCHENIATDIQSRTICRTVCFDSTDRNFAARIGRLIYI